MNEAEWVKREARVEVKPGPIIQQDGGQED